MTDVAVLSGSQTFGQRAFDFSYSHPSQRPWMRRTIRLVERLTGQPKLKRLYNTWVEKPSTTENVFSAGLRLLGVNLSLDGTQLASIPKTGPLLIIANHPYGVLDGLSIGAIATAIRPDVKIMTNSLLCRVPEAAPYLLPVDFSNSAEARSTSASTRRATQDWLRDGHCVVIFPGGSVATSQKPLRGKALETAWHPFTAKLAMMPGVSVLPVYFHGQNSRLFQIASHVHYAFRLSLLFRETSRRMGTTLRATLGAVMSPQDIKALPDRSAVTSTLRHKTLMLGGRGAPDPTIEFQWPKHLRFD
jgi:putative hemolysin